MSLTLSDMGKHVSDRDIHAATDGDVQQRFQRAERCGFGLQASTAHNTHAFRQRTRDQTQLTALCGLKCQRRIGQPRPRMYQAAAPDGDAVQYHGAHGTPSLDSAQIRHRTDGSDLHSVRREDATNIILCTGPNDHRWTKLRAER